MVKYIGNSNNIIDWNNVIDVIKDLPPATAGIIPKETDKIVGVDPTKKKYSTISEIWNNSGYRYDHGWEMYFPKHHFDNDVVDKFSEFVNIDPMSAWISRTNPGTMAPWHWDATDHEERYTEMGMLRFSCHISDPAPGHAFVVEGEYFYNQEQGNVYQWESRKSWHAGMNFGYTPKYLFNIIGTTKK